MITIHCFKDCGPYFDPAKGRYQAARLKDLIFHVRTSMEDGDDSIGAFDNGECKAIWTRETDIQPDGEGGMEPAGQWYEMHRPESTNPALWKIMLRDLDWPTTPRCK